MRDTLLNLIHSKFSGKESKEFEERLKLTITECESKNQVEGHETEQLYSIMLDSYLLRILYNIKDYNDMYGKRIMCTKDKFGTENFNHEINRDITSHLRDIASVIQVIHNDIKEAHLLLNKMTPLVYKVVVVNYVILLMNSGLKRQDAIT